MRSSRSSASFWILLVTTRNNTLVERIHAFRVTALLLEAHVNVVVVAEPAPALVGLLPGQQGTLAGLFKVPPVLHVFNPNDSPVVV